MTITKAIEHLSWKMQNVWKVSDKDQNAINTIIRFVNQKHDEDFNNNLLFAKLYITYYGELLKYYKASVFDEIPQKELHKQLDKPLDQIIQEFVNTATEVEQAKEFMIDGILKHPRQIKDKESINIIEQVMTLEEAKTNLISMCNLALNQFS